MTIKGATVCALSIFKCIKKVEAFWTEWAASWTYHSTTQCFGIVTVALRQLIFLEQRLTLKVAAQFVAVL